MSLPNYTGCLMECYKSLPCIILYENVFQNPELFGTQDSLSPEQSTLLDASRRYSTLLDAIRLYSTLLYDTILYASLRYSTLLDATRRYSTLLDASRR
jgi:hypothetical protein